MPPRPLKPLLIFAALSARLEAAPFQNRGGPSFFSSLPDSCLAAVNISTLNISTLYELHVERDRHLITNQDATGFERSVPGQTEVLTADLCGCRYSNQRIAPRLLRRRGRAFNRKDPLARNSMNGQVALYG